MSPVRLSYVVNDRDRSAALEVFRTMGFEASPPVTVRLSRLDTFDGRLHRAGLRLDLLAAEVDEVVLSGDDVVDAHLSVPAVPAFASELPAGPFRARVEALTEVRALSPRVRVTATRTDLTLRDRAGKVVASAALFDRLHADGVDVGSVPPSLLELREVVGFARPARRARGALDALGLHACPADVLTCIARSAGVDLAGFTGSPTVPLDPTAPAVDGFTRVLANLAATVDANWEGTVARVDPEFLHDLRVALRRTRAVLSEGKAVLPLDVVSTARERFKWLASLTGPARDLDVYLIEWDGYVAPLGRDAAAALEPVRQHLQRRLDSAYQQLAEVLRSEEATELRREWPQVLAKVSTEDRQGVQADRALGRVVRKRLVGAQTTLLDAARVIRSDTPAEQVHELRKDAKRLRYLIECFGTILPEGPKKQFVKRLKAFQNNLGEHQDAEVHVALLHELANELHGEGVPVRTMVAIGQLTERLEHVRIAARAEFAERFADYDTGSTRRSFDDMLDGIGR